MQISLLRRIDKNRWKVPAKLFNDSLFMPIGDVFLSVYSVQWKSTNFIINHAVMRTKEEQIMNYKFDGAKVYFTSDTHFNHANIIGFCSRPFKNVNEMNETLIANWNRVVGVDDIVFHLGDFCLGGSAEWTNVLNRLNGKIYLIVGNHDMKNLRQSYYDRFEEIVMQKHIERLVSRRFI